MKTNHTKVVTDATILAPLNQTFATLTPTLTQKYGSRFFPVKPGTKTPLAKWKKKPITHERIKQWILDLPDASIGMALAACEPGGGQYVCIDCDVDDEDLSTALWNALFDHVEGELLPRTRPDSPRWAVVVRTDGNMDKGVLTFDNPSSEAGSRIVEFLGSKQMVVIAGRHSSGVHYEWLEGGLWDVDPEQLPLVKVDDMPALADAMSIAIQDGFGVGVVSNTVSGKELTTSPDGDDADIDPDLAIPTEAWQKMTAEDVKVLFALFKFNDAHYDVGIVDHDGLIPSIDALATYKCWGIRDVSWAITSITKFNNEAGRELAFEIMYCPDHSDPKYRDVDYLRTAIERAAKDYGKDKTSYNDVRKMSTFTTVREHLESDPRYQLKRSRDVFDVVRQSYRDADANTLETCTLAVSGNAFINNSHREQLVEQYQTRYKELFGSAISKPAVRKLHIHNTSDENDDEGSSNRPLPARIFDDALSMGKAFVNQHGELFIEFETGSAMPVLSTDFMDWCLCRAQIYGDVEDDKLCKKVALNVRAKLKNEPLEVIDVHRRVAQVGTGMKDSPIELYVNMNNAEGQVVRITAGQNGGEVIASADASVRFVSGPEAGVIHKPQTPLTGTLKERVERLWHHMPVPENQRLLFLGTMVNAFFTKNHQPILALYSPPPGGDAKSPTLYRWRQLIDPRTTSLPSATSERKTFVRTLANGWCVGFDDVAQRGLPPEWQKKLNSYSTGGTDSEPTLYLNKETTVLEVAGPVGFTTNHHPITNPETLARMVLIQFEKLKNKRSAAVTEQEFSDEVDTLRWTLFELVSEVIRVLPAISDASGHRFDGYAQIVNALHQILNIPGSLAKTLAAQRKLANPDDAANDLLLQDLGHLATTGEHLISDPAGRLFDDLSQLHSSSSKCRSDREKDPTYPTNPRALTSRFKDPQFVEMAETAFLTVSIEFSKSLKQNILCLEPTEIEKATALYRPNRHRDVRDSFPDLDDSDMTGLALH